MSFATVFPLPTDTPLFTMRAILAGREYILRFDYAGREDRWYMSILDLNEVPLRRGIKVAPAVNVLAVAYHVVALPQEPLALQFAAPAGQGPPGLSDFGRVCSLILFEP